MRVKGTAAGRSSPRPGNGKKSKTAPQPRARNKPAVAPGFLTDESLQVIEFLGDTSPYLHLAPGTAVLDLHKMLPPLLYKQVREAAEQTAARRVVKRPGASFLLGEERKKINIEVTRLKGDQPGGARYRILLGEARMEPLRRGKAKAGPEPERAETGSAARLKHELAAAKESFRGILEEQERRQERALDELAAARHDSQAFAAELEAMNAELESSHAELEATAEELRSALEESEQRHRRLQESEGRVRALLETAAQGILAVGSDGRIGMVNRTAETMLGYGRKELLGRPVEMLLPMGLRAAHREHRREFFAHPRTRPMGQGLDLFARRKDGTTFPVEISLSHIDPEDDVVAVAFISDITERKQSEAQLRLQAAITANIAEGIAMVRASDAVIVYANERFHELFGHAPGEFLGKPVSVLHAGTKAEAETTAREIIEALRRNSQWRGEVRNVRKDGSEFWAALTINTFEHEEYGTVWLRVSRDVTDRKQAEDRLREELAFNAALVDTIRALVVVLDRQGRIVRFNRACEELTGYTAEEVRGRRVWDFLPPPEEATRIRRLFAQLRAGEGPNQAENYWVTKEGENRLISWSNVALADAAGNVSAVIGTGIDITDSRRMENAIRLSQSELRQLAARLTAIQEEEYKHLSRELHDVFSQKLTMLGMQAGRLERKLSEAGLADGADVGQIGAQISALAADIHGISRRLHPAILDDLGLAAALKNECAAFACEHGIAIECYPEGNCDAIPGAVALCLYRVAQTALSNVAQHSGAARVNIRLMCDPEQVVLSIEDFGRGFDVGKVRGGGGLGLVSMAERVRTVGGELTIDSAPGKGTRISVRVPVTRRRRRRLER